MPALKKEKLEQLEAKFGLEPGDLTYQHRCQRIAAVQKGEQWPPADQPVQSKRAAQPVNMAEAAKQHPIYGQRLIITPMMTPRADQDFYYKEVVGHEMDVEEFHAGSIMAESPENVDRIHGEYKIVHEDTSEPVIAKTIMPKIGTEITWDPSTELCPVVRGNDRQRGYLWSIHRHLRQYGDTMIQVQGLRDLIYSSCPELLPKFKEPGMLFMVDGVTRAASIPMVDAMLKEYKRKELQDVRLGLV